MAITLAAITLPAGLIWSDEYDWFGIARAIEPSVTGVPIIQSADLASGRPITFAGENAWMTRTELDALVALVAAAGPHTLTLHDGRSVPVQFREQPLQARPVIDYEAPAADDRYQLLALNLITTDVMTDPE